MQKTLVGIKHNEVLCGDKACCQREHQMGEREKKQEGGQGQII